MANADNLLYAPFNFSTVVRDADDGGLVTDTRQVYIPYYESSNIGFATILNAIIVQLNSLWCHSVAPLVDVLYSTSEVVSGSNVFGFGTMTVRVDFRAVVIPPWQDQQPGFPSRFPHLGRFAFLYPSGGTYVVGTVQPIDFSRKLFVPENKHPIGFWYSLAPGVSGVFDAYEPPDENYAFPYQYSGDLEREARPFADGPVAQEPG